MSRRRANGRGGLAEARAPAPRTGASRPCRTARTGGRALLMGRRRRRSDRGHAHERATTRGSRIGRPGVFGRSPTMGRDNSVRGGRSQRFSCGAAPPCECLSPGCHGSVAPRCRRALRGVAGALQARSRAQASGEPTARCRRGGGSAFPRAGERRSGRRRPSPLRRRVPARRRAAPGRPLRADRPCADRRSGRPRGAADTGPPAKEAAGRAPPAGRSSGASPTAQLVTASRFGASHHRIGPRMPPRRVAGRNRPLRALRAEAGRSAPERRGSIFSGEVAAERPAKRLLPGKPTTF